jgi:hypothetical protein
MVTHCINGGYSLWTTKSKTVILLDSWLFFLASRFRSESDESCEIIEGDEVKATLGAFLLVGCPNIYLQAEAICQTLRKGACPHFEGGSESPPPPLFCNSPTSSTN